MEHKTSGQHCRLVACLCLWLVYFTYYAESQVPNITQLPMYAEQRLLTDLFENYEASVRPYVNFSEPVQASFGVNLVNILELNQVRETLDTYLILRQAWHDARLQWNRTQYQGVSEIRLPPSKVWKPDIISFDNVESDFNILDSMIVVYASGHLIWITPLRLRTTCRVDLYHFPFDEQTCNMYFASWVYNGHQVNLTLWGGKEKLAFTLQSETRLNKEWTVTSHTAEIRYQLYKCCPEPFPDLKLTLTLKRSPVYYVHVFVIPALLIGLLVPSHMLLPPDSGQRMTIGSILLASLLLLILKLQDALPSAHSELPAIGMFYTLSFLWASLAMLSSIVVLNLHYRGPRRGKVPDSVRWLFLRSLKRLVCLGSDTYYLLNDLETITMRGLDQPKPFATSTVTNSTTSSPANFSSAGASGATTSGLAGSSSSNVTFSNVRLEREVEEISRHLNLLQARVRMQDSRAEAVNEWRLVALVLDRALFILFFVVYVLCAIIALA